MCVLLERTFEEIENVKSISSTDMSFVLSLAWITKSPL